MKRKHWRRCHVSAQTLVSIWTFCSWTLAVGTSFYAPSPQSYWSQYLFFHLPFFLSSTSPLAGSSPLLPTLIDFLRLLSTVWLLIPILYFFLFPPLSLLTFLLPWSYFSILFFASFEVYLFTSPPSPFPTSMSLSTLFYLYLPLQFPFYNQSFSPLFPGPMTQVFSHIRRLFQYGHWSWVTSIVRGQRSPTGWDHWAVTETVGSLHSLVFFFNFSSNNSV